MPIGTGDSGIGPSAIYSWTVPGLDTVAVTATNFCSQVAGSFPVQVLPSPGYRVFLPMIAVAP